ncbi:MAG: hypothetical protein RLZZ627_761 [Pseudomonadota bacterium]|jgi:hypothetical protein
MKTCSEHISEAEADIRACFRAFDVRSAAIRASFSPVSPDDSLGDIILKSTQPDPRGEHAKAEGEFSQAVKNALAKIDAGLEVAADFEVAASYLEGKSSIPPHDESVRFFCDQAKSAGNIGSGGIDLQALASDIRRNISGAKAELQRVKATWVERTKSASIVAMRGKRFLLSQSAGFQDVTVQEYKLKAVQVLHDRKFGASTRRRTEITRAK